MSHPNTPTHAPLHHFSIANGELQLGGIAISRLAARVGSSPFYAYDRACISTRIATLRTALPPSVAIHYAIKANPMAALVCHMAQHVDGLDVASAGELRIALDSGMAPARISFAGPGKRPAEIDQAVAAGVLLNIESAQQALWAGQAAQRLGLPARVAIRVNPDFELKSSGMRMSGGAKPFGIDAEAVPALLRTLPALGVSFEGFHIFAGSQNLRASSIIEAQQASYALALRLAEHAPAPVRSLNLGGGFGIPYFPGDTPLDLAPIGDNLAQIAHATYSALPHARLNIELGRYLVGEAGVYVCRIVERKESRGQVFLVTDGGLHHHLAASGNFGQVIRKNYPVVIANKMDSADTEQVSVVGPLCTPLDILADRMHLAKAAPGDFVAIYQSGAYGASASPQSFLGHPEVIEVLV